MPRNLRRLLIQLPLLGIALFSVPIAAVSHESDREQVLSFNPPACLMPCIFKVVPGETDYEDTLAWINTELPLQQQVRPEKFWIQDEAGTQIYVTVRTYPRIQDVTKIELTTYGEGHIVTLGQMLEAGYEPIRIFRGRLTGSSLAQFLIVFDEAQQILAVINADGRIEADTPIITLVMLSGEDINIAMTDIQVGWGYNYEIFWQGYTSTRRYLNTPIQSPS